MPESSILVRLSIPYRQLGFAKNPFPSIPVCGEQDNFRGKYLIFQSRRLKQLVRASRRRKNAIYVVGEPGSGKSALFRTFIEMYSEHPYIYPLMVPFPFYGGLPALYNSALRRIPLRHFAKIMNRSGNLGPSWSWFSYAKKWSNFSSWQTIQELEARSSNATIMFEGMIEGLTSGLGRQVVALLVDDVEYAWDRFVGWQKYHWEGRLATLCHDLGSNLVWVFSVNPRLSGDVYENSMPYFSDNHWKIGGDDVDLFYRLATSKVNTLHMDVNHEELRFADVKRLLGRASVSQIESEYNRELLKQIPRPIPTMGEVLLKLHERIRSDALSLLDSTRG